MIKISNGGRVDSQRSIQIVREDSRSESRNRIGDKTDRTQTTIRFGGSTKKVYPDTQVATDQCDKLIEASLLSPPKNLRRDHSKFPQLPSTDSIQEEFKASATISNSRSLIRPSKQMFNLYNQLHIFCIGLTRSFYKFFLHIFSGDCELVRICSANNLRHTSMMTVKFAQCLKHSKQLSNLSNAIQLPRLFSVNEVMVEIATTKRIKAKSPVIIANMKSCLQAIRFVNKICLDFQDMRSVNFDYNEQDHVHLLEKLWCNLKPDILRSADRLSEEWGELGFQGKDPSTDFRGMGLLSLTQLVYFSETYPVESRQLLAESLNESRYFPFAAVGINITAFMVELLQGLHIHQFIYQSMDKIILEDIENSDDGPSEDIKCVNLALTIIHEIYCKTFLEFGKQWVEESPRDVMAFPSLFAKFKLRLKRDYPKL